MKKAFITGISGFAGSFLAEHLLSTDKYEVAGTYLDQSSLTNLATIKDKILLFQADLTIGEPIKKIITSVSPDYIFHLAAIPSPAESFTHPGKTLYNNILSELNLLEAIKYSNLANAKILIVSSAQIYGEVKQSDLPIDEKTSLRPISPYGVSKIAQDYLGLQYYLSYGMHIIRVRPFNHIGPRLSKSFVASSFASKIAEIEKGKHAPFMYVGNLSAKRDFTDVRDVVIAYELLLEKGTAGEVYNLGSGRSFAIQEILDIFLSLTREKITINVDPTLFRPKDIADFVCDPTKINRTTGWKPKIPLSVSLKDTLDYWRNII